MRIEEKLRNMDLPGAERALADFLLEKKEEALLMTTRQLAEKTGSSASALVRMAKKFGFRGWTEFSEAYGRELEEARGNVGKTDPNFPFARGDSILQVAEKIAGLSREGIDETMKHLDVKTLRKAVNRLLKAKRIVLFAEANMNYPAMEFAFKLGMIGISNTVVSIGGDPIYTAAGLKEGDAAIVISYSGETHDISRVARILSKRKIEFTALTSDRNNTLGRYASEVLLVYGKENKADKIGNFGSLESVNLILNILYSLIFEARYDYHIRFKRTIGLIAEYDRFAENEENELKNAED